VTETAITADQIRELRDSLPEGDDVDLVLACDRALGLDSLDECTEHERIGIIETSLDIVVIAWNARFAAGANL
jgi:hypothetical protein